VESDAIAVAVTVHLRTRILPQLRKRRVPVVEASVECLKNVADEPITEPQDLPSKEKDMELRIPQRPHFLVDFLLCGAREVEKLRRRHHCAVVDQCTVCQSGVQWTRVARGNRCRIFVSTTPDGL
jgi:Trm5-related predicted tRNA methylase